jgi:LysR family glycine cleavage system transcriptional activator
MVHLSPCKYVDLVCLRHATNEIFWANGLRDPADPATEEPRDAMSRQLPSLNALRAFEAAARHMSFTLAADELCVTQGAVSRQIKLLESHLKVRLFRRLPRALELTADGMAYLPTLREAFDAIEFATRRITRGNQHTVLTVSVLPTLAMNWIIPSLHEFNEQHPEIEIHMVTSINPVDFNSDIDMAIRVGSRHPNASGQALARIDLVMTEDWAGIEVEELISDTIIPVCAPELLRGPPCLRRPEDLRHHTLLHTGTRPNAWADWLAASGVRGIPPGTGPSYGHFFMVIEAARQGKGIACVPDVLVAGDLASGRLAAPFPKPVDSTGTYCILYRKHQRDLPPLRAFCAWLASLAKRTRQTVASFEGDQLPHALSR